MEFWKNSLLHIWELVALVYQALGADFDENRGGCGAGERRYRPLLLGVLLCERRNRRETVWAVWARISASPARSSASVPCSIFCVRPRESASSTASTSSPLASSFLARAISSARHSSVWALSC